MSIETKCVIRCDGCGRSKDSVLRFCPVGGNAPRRMDEFVPIQVLRLYSMGPIEAGDSTDWRMDGVGQVLCPQCPQSSGPYR
jgi:hypothetical protein